MTTSPDEPPTLSPETSGDLGVAISGLLELEQRAQQWAGHCARTHRIDEQRRALRRAEQYRRVAMWLQRIATKRGAM